MFSGRICKKETEFLSKTFSFFHSMRVLFLTPWIKMWQKKNNLWLREREITSLVWPVTSNTKHWLRNRLCLLENKLSYIVCGGFLLEGMLNFCLSATCRGKGSGKWQVVVARRAYGHLSVAQGFMEYAVLWDLLPVSGISICATLDLDPLAWIQLFLSSGVRMKASHGHAQHYENKDYHYISNQKVSSSSWFQSPVCQAAIVYIIHIWIMSMKQVGHWLREFG